MIKKNFSLLEIIITIVIISIASTAVGIKIHKLIEKHRFESSCKRISAKISFAKQLSLTNQCDVFLAFAENADGLLVNLNFTPMERPSLKESVSHIHARLNLENSTKSDFVINFFSSGYISPQGKITLYDSKREKIINLKDFSPEEFWQKSN